MGKDRNISLSNTLSPNFIDPCNYSALWMLVGICCMRAEEGLKKG